jgi:DNA-binding NtrC family response regulator
MLRRVTAVTQPLVSVVDDDESVRESLPDLLKELGFAAKPFALAREFLTSGALATTRCLVLDVAMPEMSGPQLQRELTLRGHVIPIFSSPPRQTRPRASNSSREVLWSACSSPSVSRSCERRWMRRCPRAE